MPAVLCDVSFFGLFCGGVGSFVSLTLRLVHCNVIGDNSIAVG